MIYMEEINDSYIKKYFAGRKKLVDTCLVKYYYHQSGKKFNRSIYDYIVNRYEDSTSFKESLYRIMLNIEERPKCKWCNKELEFKGTSYKLFTDFCDFRCQMKYLNQFGKLNNKDSITKSKSNREKTLLNRYGVSNPYKIPEVRQKIKDTFVHKYGVDNPWKAKEIKDKLDYKLQSVHASQTKKKNNTYNTSKPEEELYLYIKEKFPLVERQYRDERYPWNCDFYIPELDLFLELQGTWTHGKHPYNPESIEDNNILWEWKNRNTKYYNNAIKTWTISDVKKRERAKENNLNFHEVWTLKDGKKLIDNLFENQISKTYIIINS